jgi:hypothetical protein
MPEAPKQGPIKNLTKEFINKAESLGEDEAMMRSELNYLKLSKRNSENVLLYIFYCFFIH